MKHINEYRRGAAPLTILLLLAVIFPLTGCDALLTVQDVDVTTQQSFVDETAIPALHAAVVDEYVDIYEFLILYTGLLADEWMSSGTFPTRVEVDRRDTDVTNATMEPMFANLSRTRAIADFVDDRFELVDTAGTAEHLRAEVRALGGMAVLHMAEAYCEGTPMSQFNFETDEVTYGPPLTRAAVHDEARVRLQAALDLAAAGSDQDYLARIGMARLLLNEGDYAGAALLVGPIPTTWVFTADHDAQSGQNNPIWSFNISQERWSVANLQGGTGLAFRDATDPRVVWARTPANDVGFDRSTPQYDLWKYPDRPAQTVIADGIEARLIEAEAALDDGAGDPNAMLTILNDLRADVETLMPPRNFNYVTVLDASGFPGTLAPLALPGTLAEQVDLLFEERALWLFATAHRLSDLRRLIRQYDRLADDVFPSGAYHKGGGFGPDVNFPIPTTEENNPQEGAGLCLNRNA